MPSESESDEVWLTPEEADAMVASKEWHVFCAMVRSLPDEPTPGRNDPCHCGSGKKYKLCCKGNDDNNSSAIQKDAVEIRDL